MSNPSYNFAYAGFWRRVLAFVIDYALCILLLWLVLTSLTYTILIPLSQAGIDLFENIYQVEMSSTILSYSVYWLYFSLFESSKWQATPGKRLCKLKVTDTNGNRLSFLRASGRYWSMLILGGLGFLMAAFTARNQALHDKIARTLVLEDFPMTQNPQISAETGEA